MAVGVVDALEMVDVKLRKQHRAAAAQAAAVLHVHHFEHGAPVGQGRQFVTSGQFAVDCQRLGERRAFFAQPCADALDAQVQRQATTQHNKHHQRVGRI
ncbi:hypothetical protein D3C71_1714340 [compost metagenome]